MQGVEHKMWKDDFSAKYGTTGNVKRLNKEIKDALNKKKSQKIVDKTLKDTIAGKYARKGGKK